MTKKEFINKWAKQVYDCNIGNTFVIDDTCKFSKDLNIIIKSELIKYTNWLVKTEQDLNGCDDNIVVNYLEEDEQIN